MNKQTSQLLEQHFDIALETVDRVKKLRELILTLAMQGKLVKQDPKDQPASELLKEIEAEKNRLVIEGKIRKQKPLPEIKKDEIPYTLPLSWKWVRLIEIADYNGRVNVAPNEISPETWVLDLEDIEKDTSIILTRSIYAERQSKSTKSTFRNGDVLYGKLRPYLNKVVVADKDGVCTTEIVPIVPFKGVDSSFLKILLKRPSFIAHVNELSYGVKMPRLGTSDAIKSIHPLPPLAEQKRIVAKIDQLMALCDKLESERNERSNKRLQIHTAAINKLLMAPDKSEFNASWNFITKNFNELYSVKENVEDLKKAILQLAVMGKLVLQDPKDQPASELLKEIEVEKKRLVKEGKIRKLEPLPEIKPNEVPYTLPLGWEWVRLIKVGKIFNGNSLNDQQKSFYSKIDSGLPYISTKHVGYGSDQIDYSGEITIPIDEDKFKVAHKNAVLICSEGGSAGKKIGIIDRDIYFGNKLIANEVYPNIEVKFVFYLYQTPFFHELFKSKMTGIIGGIPFSAFLNIPIPLPPAAEQKRIVAKIDQLMSICSALVHEIINSTNKQTSILNAVLSKI